MIHGSSVTIFGWLITTLCNGVYQFKRNRQVVYFTFFDGVLVQCDQHGQRKDSAHKQKPLSPATLLAANKYLKPGNQQCG